ncbi:hypothetical protein VPH35_021587 [Triticum aestivum]
MERPHARASLLAVFSSLPDPPQPALDLVWDRGHRLAAPEGRSSSRPLLPYAPLSMPAPRRHRRPRPPATPPSATTTRTGFIPLLSSHHISLLPSLAPSLNRSLLPFFKKQQLPLLSMELRHWPIPAPTHQIRCPLAFSASQAPASHHVFPDPLAASASPAVAKSLRPCPVSASSSFEQRTSASSSCA